MQKTMVIYNAHTMDGQAAALAAYYRIGEHADFIAFDYGKLSVIDYFIKSGSLKMLYVIGLHLTAKDIARLAHHAESICYIDHIAVELPESLNKQVKVVSIPNRCTCVTAWAHFMPTQPIPHMFQVIEDVVLGKNEISNSRSAYDGLRYRLLQCEENAFIMNMQTFLHNDIAELIMDGMHVGAMFKVISSNLATNFDTCNLLGKRVACINAPKMFAYYVCDHLLSTRNIDYVLLYSDCRSQGYVYRSWTVAAREGSAISASDVAELFEGYGTNKFAGFTTTATFRDHEVINAVNGYYNT